ncbi:uncharacterized protein LOC107635914 [Arachis ipaensis]|uniref:uncharacterized protein LOC107635914 n=1 Tax=Arachis ipaensis TaxID=130454 RepID=UPI0007AF6F30|nr:uncharacterized protein LOC107635914 [Arachis ipaensis]XP_025647174.1 uncharacterized protein LOC112742144 [Arachis hypogaea]
MPGLVGETQSAFVKDRKIHCGAFIACETVQWIKLKKKEAAIIKLDFQKAYDRVKWSFVDLVLQKMGFGQKWRGWVMECVSTCSIMIGEAVRNGCISPLLVGRDHIELLHLQFADDTILFCPPEEETIKNYRRLLRCFELMSGLSINFDKSSLVSVNCDDQWVLQMEMALEDISSYSFTRTIWKGLVPPRVKLFAWYGVLRYHMLECTGSLQVR